MTRLWQGRAAEALELAEREVLPDFRLLGTPWPGTRSDTAESDAALAQPIEVTATTAAYQVAEACGWRGEIDRAFDWLERA